MKIADMKVTELINEVGAGTPAPGGGAVAGLAGGVGVALTMMVNGLTLDKKGFENDRERLLDAIAKGNELKERFIDVMNRDSEVFDVLIESLALPKDDDEHKAIRRGAVQASFRNCTLVPLTMMEICSEAIDLCAGLVGTTNPNVVSDLGIAALSLKTAMESAWLNVLINLSSLKDKAFRDECCQKGEALLAHAVPIAQESYEKVIKVITEKYALRLFVFCHSTPSAASSTRRGRRAFFFSEFLQFTVAFCGFCGTIPSVHILSI